MAILIKGATAVLMDRTDSILSNACVAVEGEIITFVGKQRPQGTFEQEIDGSGKVLLPGLVNCHTHLPMVAMRGYGDGHDLQDWLKRYIFPVEERWDDRAIRCCADLGLAELIASGVTTIADMYAHTDTIAQAAAEAGINANLSCGAYQFQTLDPDTDPFCRTQRELIEKWHGYHGGQIQIDASIHAEYTSRPELWRWMAQYAADHQLRMHVHISETKNEHQACVARYGKTPVQVLDDCGVWEGGGIAAHCVWTDPEDWAIMARKGVSCVHNPVSNLKLGSGIAPIKAMLRAGVNVTLGTDGVSSNNCTDFFGDLKLAAILHNGAACDPLAILPGQALAMATTNGATALGRHTGRIVPGYMADMILVDFSHLNLFPCHDIVSNLVYAAHGCDVSMTMARGKVLYQDGAHFTIDVQRAREEARRYALPLLFPKG